MRWITSPFSTPIAEYSDPGWIEKSLNPFATPFLNDGTIRACVATMFRFESVWSMYDFFTSYLLSATFFTASGGAPVSGPAGAGRAAAMAGAAVGGAVGS